MCELSCDLQQGEASLNLFPYFGISRAKSG